MHSSNETSSDSSHSFPAFLRPMLLPLTKASILRLRQLRMEQSEQCEESPPLSPASTVLSSGSRSAPDLPQPEVEPGQSSGQSHPIEVATVPLVVRDLSWSRRVRPRLAESDIRKPINNGGLSDYVQRVSSLPRRLVFDSVQDFARWPQILVHRVLDVDTLAGQRLQSLLQAGSVAHTDYSGCGGAETSMRMLELVLPGCGISLPRRSLKIHRSCDNNKKCQEILLDTEGASHVFEGILERLPADVLARVAELTSKSDHPGCVLESHQRIDEYLTQNASDLFGWTKRAPIGTCLRHPNSQCLISSRGLDDTEDIGRPPITESWGSCMCTPWCSMGDGLGLEHGATPAYSAWVTEAATLLYDMTWLENSPNFPIDIFEAKFGGRAHVLTLTFGPEHLGWPVHRRRLLAVALSRETLVWIGPRTEDELAHHFASFFLSAVTTEADIFLGTDSAENHRLLRRHMSKNRGAWPRPGQELRVEDLMPKGVQNNFVAMQQRMREEDRCGAIGGAFLADISQNPSERPRYCGPWLPTIIQNSNTYVLSGPAPGKLTAGEINFAQGWPLEGLSSTECLACVPGRVKSLSFSKRQHLLGNGVHLMAIGAWMLYIKAHCLRVDVLSQMAPPMPPPGENEEIEVVQAA